MIRERDIARQSTENSTGVEFTVRVRPVHERLLRHHCDIRCLCLTRINVLDQVIAARALPQDDTFPVLETHDLPIQVTGLVLQDLPDGRSII